MTISTELQPSTFTPERIPSQSQYSILLADTNIEFRRGLRSLLEFYDHHGSTRCVVVGEAVSKGQVLQQAAVLHPRLVLLDTDLEESWEETVELIKELQRLDRPPSVLLISDEPDSDCLFKGMQAGAAGYLTKDRIATELFAAINTVKADQIYLSQSMVNTFFCLFQSSTKQSLKKCKMLKLSTQI